MGVFDQALSNISKLRADNGSDQSQLNFAADNLILTRGLVPHGRIEDVDIAEESANLAKYSILTQASAAMVAQANEQSQSTIDCSLGCSRSALMNLEMSPGMGMPQKILHI